MNVSIKKLLFAVVVMVLCIVFWQRRMDGLDPLDFSFHLWSPAAQVKTVAPASQPQPQQAETTVKVGDIAPVLATIDWSNPLDPAAITLGWRGDHFLIDTREGIQLWHGDTLKSEKISLPVPNAHLMENIWMQTSGGNDNGILFAIKSEEPAPTATLLWIDSDTNDQRKKFPLIKQMNFPEGFMPSALVRLTSAAALICSSTAKRALVVAYADSNLRQLTSADLREIDLRSLHDVGVIGPVEGFGEMKDVGLSGYPTIHHPVWFDTNTCAWVPRTVPEPLASGLNLKLTIKRMPSFDMAPSIVAASWIDPVTKAPRTLETPLVWSGSAQQWRARHASDFPGMPPNRVYGVANENWSYAAALSQGKFEFLSQEEDLWRESIQRLPPAEDMKLLPIGQESVLALLIDSKQPGRVVRLDPQKLESRHHSYANYEGFVPLSNGELLAITGPRASNVHRFSPTMAEVVSERDLPQPEQRVSGVELADGNVVVFGGLSPACRSSDMPACIEAAQPSFRWIRAEKRWQPLPTLAVPFSYGEPLDGGNSDIDSGYSRSNFVLRQGKELFYLTGDEAAWSENHDVAPTRLYRWALDGFTDALATTRIRRSHASLLELADGRFAAIGGSAKDEPECPACTACQTVRNAQVAALKAKLTVVGQKQPKVVESDDGDEPPDPDAMVPQCEACNATERRNHFKAARSSEIFSLKSGRWSAGPFSIYPGGRAIKMSNGRIFKLGLLGYNASDATYAAETSDTALTKWSAALPFPLRSPAEISQMFAIGNQILIVLAKPGDRYVIWNDDSRTWQVHPLPRHSHWSTREQPIYASPGTANQLLLVYYDMFEYIDWPPQ